MAFQLTGKALQTQTIAAVSQTRRKMSLTNSAGCWLQAWLRPYCFHQLFSDIRWFDRRRQQSAIVRLKIRQLASTQITITTSSAIDYHI